MLDVIKDSLFYKFTTRLSDIENEYGEIAFRERKEFVNRFGHKSSYNVYSAYSKIQCEEIYQLYEK